MAPFCVVQLMGNLDFPQAVEEIKQAAKWLKEQGAPKVGPLFAIALPVLCSLSFRLGIA